MLYFSHVISETKHRVSQMAPSGQIVEDRQILKNAGVGQKRSWQKKVEKAKWVGIKLFPLVYTPGEQIKLHSECILEQIYRRHLLWGPDIFQWQKHNE